MTVYEIFDILTGLFESIVAFMLFDNYLERKTKFPFFIYWLGVVGLTIGINVSNNIFNISILNISCIIFFTFIMSFLYNGNVKTKIVLSVVSFAMSACAEVTILFVLAIIKNVDAMVIVTDPSLRLLGILLSKTLNFGFAKIICMFGRRRLSKIQTSYWVLFASVFITTVLTIYLIFSTQSDVINTSSGYLSVVCSLGLLYGIFITLYLYERMSEQALQLRKKELLEQQFDEQVKHLNELILVHEQTKSIKHDLANHMISLKSYLQEGKYEEGNKYLNKLINSADIGSDMIDTGNIVIDAIITAKRNLAQEKGIDFHLEIQIPENLKMDSSDCCVIFGNALDNAIEACEKVKNNKFIRISLVYYEESLICKISNSTIHTKNPLLKTTKTDFENHGIGLTNIKNTLNKYKNMFRIEQEHDEFVLSFILFELI